MKRLIGLFALLTMSGSIYASGGQAGLVVSSGTYRSISLYDNDDGGYRQSIIIGDRISSTTLRVDPIIGITVNLGTSTAAGIGSLSAGTAEIGNVKNAGTFATQAAQSGTWTVQPGNTANSTAWKVDGSAVTQPVSGTFWQATQPVSGTFWQATQPISGSISNTSFIATQTTNASLHASCDIDGSSNTVQSAQSGTWTVQPGNTANTTAWKVDGSAVTQPISGSISNTSFAATQTTNASLHASVDIDGSSNTVKAAGDVAGGSSDSGNPVKIGGIGHTTYQTAVTDAQRVDAAFDSEGKQLMMPYAVPALSTSGVTAAMTGVTDTVLISSGGANINTYVNHILCTNSHATVSTFVNIKNGQTVRYTGYAVAAGGGFSATLPTALPGASNSQWSAADVTTGANVICDMVGYFAKN